MSALLLADIPCKKSIADLPPEMIYKIFTYLDFAERSRVRVNRRLKEIEDGMPIVKERGDRWKRVHIIASSSSSPLGIVLPYGEFDGMSDFSVDAFKRIAKHVHHFEYLEVSVDFRRQNQFELVEHLHLATADNLLLTDKQVGNVAPNVDRRINFEVIRDLLASYKKVTIRSLCIAITMDDLFTLKEIIRNNKSKGHLELGISDEVAFTYADRFFGLHRSSFTSEQNMRTNAQIQAFQRITFDNHFVVKDTDIETSLTLTEQSTYRITFNGYSATWTNLRYLDRI